MPRRKHGVLDGAELSGPSLIRIQRAAQGNQTARQWWDSVEAVPGSMADRARHDPALKAKILVNMIEANRDLASMEFWHGHGCATLGSTK